MDDGYRLPLASWLPDGEPCRVVLAVHGFNDFHMAFEALGPALSEDCVAVYAHDQRGFGATVTRGRWPGKEVLADDVVTLATMLHGRYRDVPLYLVGESMGAAVVMLAMTGDESPPVAGAVLLAPAVWTRAVQPWYMRIALWLSVRIMPGLKLSPGALDLQASDLPEVVRYWREHPMIIQRTRVDAVHGVTNLMDAALAMAGKLQGPLLILYGGRDEIVPPVAMCALQSAWPDDTDGEWRFVYYPDGYHLLTRDSRAQETIHDIAGWLASPDTREMRGMEPGREELEQILCH